MKLWLLLVSAALAVPLPGIPADAELTVMPARKAYLLPIRDDIMPPLVYLVRRGVKEAMDAKADLLVLDMETNGGRVDSTEEIIEILSQFKGETVTYVNRNAYSAGAFIAVATQRIFMAPESVIGAAAPIMLSPGGTGVEAMPETMEIKATSAISAKIRAQAQKNGHNSDVVEAMIDKQKELI
ncbi:MAG TPA: ATP-dependent Clp protease proteolytic subunit, partial [Verrucomicrobiota bacterium]|nr:ATP-dependent Clp protease proteolytic subunit [Verrucomicrobiota bacterium]